MSCQVVGRHASLQPPEHTNENAVVFVIGAISSLAHFHRVPLIEKRRESRDLDRLAGASCTRVLTAGPRLDDLDDASSETR
jgi:hypothetical protein